VIFYIMKKIKTFLVLVACCLFLADVYAVDVDCGVEVVEINYDDNISNSGYEWVKLQNRSGRAINISGWTVGDDDSANMTLSQESGWGDITSIPDGATFVICEPASSGNDFVTRYASFKSTSNYLARTSGSWNFSTTSGDKIRISSVTETGDNSDIQRFTFLPYSSNRSIVKTSFYANEDLVTSWRSGMPGGTPFGVVNISTETFITLRLWTENHPFDPTNYQTAKINFETDRDAVKTIYIFDVRGREVARPVDSDDSISGMSLKGIGSGSLLWDGKLKDGSYAAVGIYIVCLEVKSGVNTRRTTALVSVGKER